MLILVILVQLAFIGIAYKFPKLTLINTLLLGFVPRLFLYTNYNSLVDDVMQFSFGLRAVDIILIGMAGAVLVKLLDSLVLKKKLICYNNLAFLLAIISVFMLFEIFRNIRTFGISALGEFRFRYLILIVPVYISNFLMSEKNVIKGLKSVIYISVIIPIIVIPFVLANNRTEGGTVFRIFGPEISLGFMYAILIVFLIGKSIKLNLAKYFKFALLPVSVLMITDTHRSVWLSAIGAFLILVKFKYLKLSKLVVTAISISIIFYLSLFVIKDIGFTDPLNYLAVRANDIYTATEGHQNTGYWRLTLWKANILDTYKNYLILGKGFGGYWDVYVPELHAWITVFPHSLYIMTFVKLGVIGLILYLLILSKLYNKFKNNLERFKRKKEFTYSSTILLLGIVVLIIQHIYYFMYSFSYLSLIYLGLFYSYYTVIIREENDFHPHSSP